LNEAMAATRALGGDYDVASGIVTRLISPPYHSHCFLIGQEIVFLIIDYEWKTSKMNYNISFSDMNRLARQANSKKSNVSLEQMRKQAAQLKISSGSKVKKQQQS